MRDFWEGFYEQWSKNDEIIRAISLIMGGGLAIFVMVV
jgi:hypothetical protein